MRTTGGPHRLFVYGSLMFSEVWETVVGESKKRSVQATAFGYLAFRVAGETYPGLVPSTGDGSVTEGVLVFDLTAEDWERLDAFEGSFYERVEIEVRTVASQNEETHRAQTYLVRDGFQDQLSDQLWDVDEFAVSGLRDFIDRFVG